MYLSLGLRKEVTKSTFNPAITISPFRGRKEAGDEMLSAQREETKLITCALGWNTKRYWGSMYNWKSD